MTTTIMIRDEAVDGTSLNEFALDLLTESVTVRELIRSRVYQEVDDHNRRQTDMFRGLVQPTDSERVLNGFRMKTKREIDWKPQFERACDAFEQRSVIIIVNDRQAESLDETVILTPDSTVSFLKLTPLVGG